jgi:hypothetical protein
MRDPYSIILERMIRVPANLGSLLSPSLSGDKAQPEAEEAAAVLHQRTWHSIPMHGTRVCFSPHLKVVDASMQHAIGLLLLLTSAIFVEIVRAQ